MKWKEFMGHLGIALLVSVFALFCSLAIWKLSGGQESLSWDREAALAERCDLLASAKLSSALLTETSASEPEKNMLTTRQEHISRQSERNHLPVQNEPRLLTGKA